MDSKVQFLIMNKGYLIDYIRSRQQTYTSDKEHRWQVANSEIRIQRSGHESIKDYR